MAQTPPIIIDEVLTYQQNGSTADVKVGSAGWYTWLESASTFTFRSVQGSFTARKERAGNRRGEPYWRAYHKRSGKLHRAYLGKSGELTLERLRSIAAMLAAQGTEDGSLDRQKQTAGTSGSPRESSSTAHRPHHQAPVENSVKARPSFADLPAPLTAFIGREQEQAMVCRLLRRPEVRLVTLTGTGGVGKTRLGLQVAADLLEEFADGVHFVSVATISDPDLVMPTIAETLAIKETGARSLLDLLKAFLQNKHLLLVLDNFEQVLPAAPALTDLLAFCPQLKLLVTSRFTLNIRGEHEFSVPPLAVPDLTQLPALADLAQVETVRLFIERARAIKADLTLTEVNARAIAEICVRLDGLPLAIELAAARIKLLPPQALLKRLSRRLEVLTGGAQDLPARQQTLRNTIQWSYDLLSQEDQRLFRWLSIFAGGCILEDAEAVCQAGNESAFSVLEGVASLLDKSLVLQPEREGEEPRLVMLETIREFGLECLAGDGELEAARRAHARYYLELAEQAGLELQGPRQATWLERLEQERDNLRAALEWALEEAEGQVAERRELALRLCVALEGFWVQHGHYREARTFLERALARSEGERTSLRARVLQVAAYGAILQGDYDRAEGLVRPGLALFRELGDARGIAHSLFLLGRITYPRGQTAEALSLMEERVRLMRQIGEPGEVADALFHLAFEFSVHGEYARGLALFEEALVLFGKAGNELMVGVTLVQSAYVLLYALGDMETIRQRLQEGQALINKVGSWHWSAYSSCIVGLLALREGETARASSLIQESLAVFREMGSRWYLAAALNWLGRVKAQQGELEAAFSSYQESLALCLEQGEQFITPFNLEGLAGVVAAQRELKWAAQLWGAAEALHEAIAIPLPPADRADYEQAVQSARAQLGAAAFAAAWQEGRTMTPGQALAAQGQVTVPTPTPAGSLSTPPTKTARTYPAGLTTREVEVMRLVAEGMTNAQIAEHLTISLHTVNAHVRSIFNKLDVNSRNAVTRFAIEHKLL